MAASLFPDSKCNARRFRHSATMAFVIGLFRRCARLAGANTSLHDLHHAHFFYNASERTLGLLFHAREYPMYDPVAFPYSLGYCQTNSTLQLSCAGDMGLRNVVWLLGNPALVLLDSTARLPLGTVYESELGKPVGDVFFFDGAYGRPMESVNRGVYVVDYT